MTVWLVIRVAEPFEIGGVFSTELAAADACKRPNDCIGPLELDQRLPDEPMEWPGAYYPLAEMEL